MLCSMRCFFPVPARAATIYLDAGRNSFSFSQFNLYLKLSRTRWPFITRWFSVSICLHNFKILLHFLLLFAQPPSVLFSLSFCVFFFFLIFLQPLLVLLWFLPFPHRIYLVWTLCRLHTSGTHNTHRVQHAAHITEPSIFGEGVQRRMKMKWKRVSELELVTNEKLKLYRAQCGVLSFANTILEKIPCYKIIIHVSPQTRIESICDRNSTQLIENIEM